MPHIYILKIVSHRQWLITGKDYNSGLLINNYFGVLGDIKRLLDDPDGLRRDEPKNRLLVGHEAALNVRLYLEANNGIDEF